MMESSSSVWAATFLPLEKKGACKNEKSFKIMIQVSEKEKPHLLLYTRAVSAHLMVTMYTSFMLSWYIRIRLKITSDRNEVWAWDLYHSTALVEAAKSLSPLNVIGYGEVLYQKPQLKFMEHGIYTQGKHSVQCQLNVNRV